MDFEIIRDISLPNMLVFVTEIQCLLTIRPESLVTFHVDIRLSIISRASLESKNPPILWVPFIPWGKAAGALP